MLKSPLLLVRKLDLYFTLTTTNVISTNPQLSYGTVVHRCCISNSIKQDKTTATRSIFKHIQVTSLLTVTTYQSNSCAFITLFASDNSYHAYGNSNSVAITSKHNSNGQIAMCYQARGVQVQTATWTSITWPKAPVLFCYAPYVDIYIVFDGNKSTRRYNQQNKY